MRVTLLKTIGLLLWLFGAPRAEAQPLREGDRLGGVRFPVALNYEKNHLRLGDFSDRPVVLVFWTTGCKSFERNFRSVEALQRRFSGRLQLVYVSREDPDSVRAHFRDRPDVAPPALPMVSIPRKLLERLPASGYPFTLWLDRAHRARYLTAHYNLTAAHLEDFLAGRSFYARSYWKEKGEATPGKSTGLESAYYSRLMPCGVSEEAGAASGPAVEARDVARLSVRCVPALNLFRKAFEEEINFNKAGSLVLELKDSARWLLPADSNRWDRWFAAHHYSYELVLPGREKEQMKKAMQQDLERYFPLQARVEKQLRPTYVLVRTTTEDRLRSLGGPEQDRQLALRHPVPADSLRPFINKPFAQWIEKMKVLMGTHYLVDSTGYAGNVDITLRASSLIPLNVEELRRDLQRHGLDLLLQERPQDVLMIREKKE